MSIIGRDTLKTRRTVAVGGEEYDYFSLSAAADAAGLGDIERLPFSLRVLLENLIRLEDGRAVTVNDIKAVGAWLKSGISEHKIAFRPARVLTLLEPRLTGDPGAESDLDFWGAGTFDAGNPYFYDLAIGLWC